MRPFDGLFPFLLAGGVLCGGQMLGRDGLPGAFGDAGVLAARAAGAARQEVPGHVMPGHWALPGPDRANSATPEAGSLAEEAEGRTLRGTSVVPNAASCPSSTPWLLSPPPVKPLRTLMPELDVGSSLGTGSPCPPLPRDTAPTGPSGQPENGKVAGIPDPLGRATPDGSSRPH